MRVCGAEVVIGPVILSKAYRLFRPASTLRCLTRIEQIVLRRKILVPKDLYPLALQLLIKNLCGGHYPQILHRHFGYLRDLTNPHGTFRH
uniref:AlNc14C223G9147 protein n=1 Tax=Albugo laibachii Nc14 TaxID=890382 RepID=F0WS04_9STRA|nr:AlNc14C223G9147 [Albugo laibachii Nc14]|eukprot:CCA24122.1 AlNc14C223G9147 [Albugo laibachii Nc14]